MYTCIFVRKLYLPPFLFFHQHLSVMTGRVAAGRLQVLQIYRLLQCVHEGDKAQIEKMVNLGVENLINLTEPQDSTGVLHVAVSANNQGDGPPLYSTHYIHYSRVQGAPLVCCGNLILLKLSPMCGQYLKAVA